MIVGFDGTVLRGPRTGIGYYTQLLMTHLKGEHDCDIRAYNGFVLRPYAATPGGSGPTGVTASGARRADAINRLKSLPGARPAWNNLKKTGFVFASRQLHLFHATNYLAPADTRVPTLHLIHDVSHIRHPEWHPRARVHWLAKRSIEFARAPVLHTVSHFSAREIAETLGIPPERIHVTYPGINPAYRKPAVEAPAILRGLDLRPGQFFLCVGTLEPRKNISLAVEAYVRLPRTLQNAVPLLIVGPSGWGDLKLPPASNDLARRGRLRFMGYVDERTMAALYQECAALLFPSSYEGFGMPVSEAMAMGSRPVVAKDGAPEEVAGDLGLALSLGNAGPWAETMERALDEKWHGDASLRQALQERTQIFDWHANAKATHDLYRMLTDNA